MNETTTESQQAAEKYSELEAGIIVFNERLQVSLGKSSYWEIMLAERESNIGKQISLTRFKMSLGTTR